MKYKYDVIIIGSGAAGYGTALWLRSFGVNDICVVTEDKNAGTSRNAGSDKQTYYKLDICSPGGDSVTAMAADLFAGGSMNGSDAMLEAANSPRCFMRLVDLGVPFPCDSFGRYAGYKTDHDNTARATSAGPLTSRYMTEKLEKRLEELDTEILDGYQVIKLIVRDGRCHGVICLKDGQPVRLYSKAVVMCTGAPCGIYHRSVYPLSQRGATGLAIEAGAALSNFQEWQYGIASVKFRWNLSGSYQQVIPRYFSVTPDGEEREFLLEAGKPEEMYSKVFLKGYQWPFDYKKLGGSSAIDLLVSEEVRRGNRVFLDYRRGPKGLEIQALREEAVEYLRKTDSFAPTPFERLMKMNPKAVKLYKDNGIDLENEPLEIDICAQHNNGGIRVDLNGETTVKGLFAVGEASGRFGVYRPGGSALNDTQAGGLQAAKYIASVLKSEPEPEECGGDFALPPEGEGCDLEKLHRDIAVKMSENAGVFRSAEGISALLGELTELFESLDRVIPAVSRDSLGEYFALRSDLISSIALCRTELSSIENIGSRGGCVCFSGGKMIDEKVSGRGFVTVTLPDSVVYEPVDALPGEVEVFEKLLKAIK